ncbi:hypothetical protein CDAR_67991 [Caerostris darwini]|uniref:Uncharacterized protein n=1 Tax=Caerostris darwini TaxID=1538125 RepID=A0AAV4VRY8_9ARAC|nr:hypothetical protein CDAR_67991 [Caerostris darwini]
MTDYASTDSASPRSQLPSHPKNRYKPKSSFFSFSCVFIILHTSLLIANRLVPSGGHHGRLSAPTDWRRKDHPRDTTPPHSFQLIRHRHSIKSQKACEPEQTVYTPGSSLRGNSHRGAELLNGVGSCQGQTSS